MDKKALSEADICTKFITPSIVSSGWDLKDQIRQEVNFTNGRIIVNGDRIGRGERKRAMRSGEAKRPFWTDFDPERRTITLNLPEKGGNPRMWKISAKLTGMINSLQRKSLRIFGDGPINSLKTTFVRVRRRLAFKLKNPRLDQIHFQTLSHWKATMEYHRTKDIFHVKEFLRHKKLDNIPLYVQIDERLFKDTDDGFTC